MAGLFNGFSGPDPESDNWQTPTGYNATKCHMFHSAAKSMQARSAGSKLGTNDRDGDKLYDIEWMEPVWGFDTGTLPTKSEFGVGKGVRGGQSVVLSTIVGLDNYLGAPEAVKKSHGSLNAYIMSKIRFIGFAAATKKYTHTEKDNRTFAVAISGVVTRRVHRAVRVGDSLMLKTPSPELLNSGYYQSMRGVSPGKVTLDLVPVRQVELAQFASTCLEVYETMRSQDSSEQSVGYSNMAAFGASMRGFVLRVANQAFYRALQCGYLQIGAGGPAPEQSFLPEVRDGSKLFYQSAPDGHTISADNPEQVAILMARVMGLINDDTSEKTPKAGYEYKSFLKKQDLVDGMKFANELVKSILHRTYSDEKYIVGNKENDLAYKEEQLTTGQWSRIGSGNGYDKLETCYASTFRNLMIGITGITQLEKSMVVGMCTKDAQAGSSTYLILAK